MVYLARLAKVLLFGFLIVFAPVSAEYGRASEALRFAAVRDRGSLELRDFQAQLVTSNLQALFENVRMFRSGARRIAVVTYLWHRGLAPEALAHHAILAAREGARVTVVVDALTVWKRDRKALLETMRREGVDVRLFNTLSDAKLGAVRRIHEKNIYREDRAGLVEVMSGGRNKGDPSFLGDDVFDVDLKLLLDARQGQEFYKRQFAALLRSQNAPRWVGLKGYREVEHGEMLDRIRHAARAVDELFKAQLSKEKAHRPVLVKWAVFMRSRGKRRTVTEVLNKAFEGARRDITFANAYFIPDERQRAIFIERARQGVSVEGFTNSISSTPHRNVVRLMENEVAPLLKAGLRLHASTGGEVHAKAGSIDGQLLYVTSANFDGLSRKNNLENGILLDSPALAAQFNAVLAWRQARGGFSPVAELFKARSRAQSTLDRCMSFLLAPAKDLF